MSGNAFHIRAGDLADLDAVLAIERACEGAPQWSECVWRGLLQTSVVSPPFRQLFVAVDRGFVAGFLVVMLSGEVAEIETIAVMTDLRRRGLGKALCRHAMRWAAERGASHLELEVRSQALGARALYLSLGFTEQGVRRGYYQHPKDDATLLVTTL